MDDKLTAREESSVRNSENIANLKENQRLMHEELQDVHSDLKEILKAVK
jgi:hypothetical protein